MTPLPSLQLRARADGQLELVAGDHHAVLPSIRSATVHVEHPPVRRAS